MSSRKLILALALVAFTGAAWADNPEPKRDTQPASATSQGKEETKAPASSSASSEPAAAPVPAETRDTAPNDAYASQGRRHGGASQADIDFANRYYPGG